MLNDTIAALPRLFSGRGVTLIDFDPARMVLLKAAGLLPRTLLCPTVR